MQKNKVKLSKKIIGMGITSVAVLCLHKTSAQQPPKRIMFQIPKISQSMSRAQLEENFHNLAEIFSVTVTNANGTEETIRLKDDALPDFLSQADMIQGYYNALIRSGVPKDEAIRQMQFAFFSGQFNGNKTGNAAPTDGCNIV